MRQHSLQPKIRLAKLPVLLIPGLLCDAAVWSRQIASLEAAGAGPVIVATHGYANSITAMAQQAIANMPAGDFAMAGHSMGGRVALEVLRIAPHRVAKIALMDTDWTSLAGGDAGDLERSARLALLNLARENGMRSMGEVWAAGMVHPEAHPKQVFVEILDMVERSDLQTFEAQVNALLSRPDATQELKAIECPAMVLCGREDLWAPLERHQAMVAQIANATLTVVESSGHMVTMERPDETSRALLNWLEM